METVDGEFLKREEAREIAVKGRALVRCPVHSDVLIDQGDPTQAYQIASSMFRDEELQGHYQSLRELTDLIKEEADEGAMDCPSCEKG